MTVLELSRVTSTRRARSRFELRLPFGLSLFLLGLGSVGCGQRDAPPAPAPDEPVEAREEADRHHEALAKLSAEDQDLAERQGICPVTEKSLGWMGTPVKITVEGRDVLLCCAGCEDAVRDAPEEYFEKLDRD